SIITYDTKLSRTTDSYLVRSFFTFFGYGANIFKLDLTIVFCNDTRFCRNIRRCTTDVECTKCQLCTRLTYRLCCDNPYSFTHLNTLTGSKVPSITSGTDATFSLTS